VSAVTDLIDAWTRRDTKYRDRRNPMGGPALSDSEVNSVRWWRKKECYELADATDRDLALIALGRWSPPPARLR
jgi:hypothetical protein